jgi:hypothetical protein
MIDILTLGPIDEKGITLELGNILPFHCPIHWSFTYMKRVGRVIKLCDSGDLKILVSPKTPYV